MFELNNTIDFFALNQITKLQMGKFELGLLYIMSLLWAFLFILFGMYSLDISKNERTVSVTGQRTTTSTESNTKSNTKTDNEKAQKRDKALKKKNHYENLWFIGNSLIVVGILPIFGLMLYSLSTVD
jgi:hypothetical protein